MDISVIIPAYNEEDYIAHTIESIKKWMPRNLIYEVILVDHGSTDQTINIANAKGAVVIDGKKAITIAALRNLGARHSTGEIFFFIDADVTFSEEWSQKIGEVVMSLKDNPNKICGSHPVMPVSSNILIKNWFNPKSVEVSPNYIGACHLIISKTLFISINGFPESMETSEEVALCRNAKNQGAVIQADPELLITHNGAPTTLWCFIKSEVWHGRGDWMSISSILSSRVALLSLGFIFLHVLLFYFLLKTQMINLLVVALTIAMMCIASSFLKFLKHGFFHAVANAPTFYLYFLSRSFSIVSTLISRNSKKRSRSS